MITGPQHWELLLRARYDIILGLMWSCFKCVYIFVRAVDNQVDLILIV